MTSRRDFLTKAGLAGAAGGLLWVTPSMTNVASAVPANGTQDQSCTNYFTVKQDSATGFGAWTITQDSPCGLDAGTVSNCDPLPVSGLFSSTTKGVPTVSPTSYIVTVTLPSDAADITPYVKKRTCEAYGSDGVGGTATVSGNIVTFTGNSDLWSHITIRFCSDILAGVLNCE